MEDSLFLTHYDLVTPDGVVSKIHHREEMSVKATVCINNISPKFVGFDLPQDKILFNLKSTLAQVGIDAKAEELELSCHLKSAQVLVKFIAIDTLGKAFLPYFDVDMFVGKLFADDERRKVRDPQYLSRMFGRSDRQNRPLLALGGLHGSDDFILEKVEGRTVAFLRLKEGIYLYEKAIFPLLETLAKALKIASISSRLLLKLHQVCHLEGEKKVKPNHLLLVYTPPLHIRTVFGRVVDSLLPNGCKHTAASVLQPDTDASGDIYELYGSSPHKLNDIPLEFYTLEPYREHVFFSDRDQLQNCIENPQTLIKAMQTAPNPPQHKCAVFVVKGTQLLSLQESDWSTRESIPSEFPGIFHPHRQAALAENYVMQQPAYPILDAIEKGTITSQGILLTRYFPSPLMKRLFLTREIQKCLKGLYFRYPSRNHDCFFSHEDRSFLSDLAKFGIPTYWIDEKSATDEGKILQYVPKPEKDSGMFVPLSRVKEFSQATLVGIYGSNLIEGNFEEELTTLLKGLLELKPQTDHPLLNSNTPLALVTGGGPGAMSLGNKVAKALNILSCANIVDFNQKGSVVNEQKQNPFFDAKMTYRLDRLVERQAEFHLDLPIFLMGGIGTDFEFCLEEVRRKTGVCHPTPILLFGPPEYWKNKITTRFVQNCASGTIKGSEWVSNCFYCIQNAYQGLYIYKQFFQNALPIGPKGPVFKEGFQRVTLPNEGLRP